MEARATSDPAELRSVAGPFLYSEPALNAVWADEGVPVSVLAHRPAVGERRTDRAGLYATGASAARVWCALTAHVSQVLRDAGLQVVLRTELGNSTAQGVYERIGFEKVADYSRYALRKDRAMPIDEQRLQAALDALVEAGAAGALAQYREGDQVWSGSSGVAQLGSSAPVNPAGSFRAGSITKTFTATVVLQLISEGVLSLSDSVDRWLPGLIPGGDKITLHQLLNHTSGLYNYTDDLQDPGELVRDRFLHWEPARSIAMATAHEPRFDPGASWSYCNTNYTLLGLVIEVATGNSYEAEVQSRILSRLELDETYLPGDDTVLPEPHAHGYIAVDGELIDLAELNASQAWSAGAIVSTASDLNRFYSALLTGELLGPAELRALRTTVATDADHHRYGLGVSRLSLPGLEVWGYSGGIHGFFTWSYHSADATRQITLSLTSTEADRPDTHDLLIDLLALQTQP